AIAMRTVARNLPFAPPLSIGREPGELFTPKVYIHGLVLPNPDRIGLKGHGLLRLPVCNRVELTGFATLPTTLEIRRCGLEKSDSAGGQLRGGLPGRKFRYGAFVFEQRKRHFRDVTPS